MVEVVRSKGVYTLERKDYDKLYSKGFGEKIGKSFTLDIFEVMFLIEKGKISVVDSKGEKVSIETIRKCRDFNFQEYVVYKDLKKKGYFVKTALKYGFSFRVYDKGVRKASEAHALWLVDVSSERDRVGIRDISAKNRVAHTSKKSVLMAVVDSEFSVTYFEMNWKKL